MWSIVASLAFSSSVPRVVSLPVHHAQQAMQSWGANVVIPTTGELGAVAVVHGRVVHAAAVIERRDEDRIHVWCVASDDGRSASLLLKALTDAAPNFTHDLEPRWQIALAYFRPPSVQE